MKYTLYLIFIVSLISCDAVEDKNTQKEIDKYNKEMILFVGSYTDKEGHVDGQADGIYSLKFDPKEGKLTKHHLSVKTTNPSYIHVNAQDKKIYAVNEKVGEQEAVSAFSYDQDSIRYINKLSSSGGAPCHITQVDNHIIIANYVGGNHVVYPLKDDGALGEATQNYQYKGKGLTSRQEAPHAHMVIQNPHTKELLGVDLGTDIITFFNFEKSTGSLNKTSECKLPPGSGPRHVDFNQDKDIIYVLNELNGSIDVLERKNDIYTSVQNIESTKSENRNAAGCAAIKVHQSGEFLYASNRGTINSISVYSIDKNGMLTMVEEVSTNGDGPRDFTIDPSGQFLLVGHQNSNNINIFKIDNSTGKLTDTENTISVPTPVCLKFSIT